MPKFSVLNRTNKAVNLAIEPWADLVVISPNGHADFDYDEPGEVEFGLMPDGEALVSVMSDRLRYFVNGREEEWKDKTGFLTSHLRK